MCRSFIKLSSCKILFYALAWLLLSAVPTRVLAQDAQGLWSSIPKATVAARGARHTVPQQYRTFSLNKAVLGRLLSNVPTEKNGAIRSSQAIIILPLPDGSLARFRFVETATMAPELAARFPQIRTFSGVGVDNPSLTATFDFTPAGFHGMIHSPAEGLSFIDPFSQGDTDNYQVYAKKDYVAGPTKAFIEERVEGTDSPIARQIAAAVEKKRTERLAQPSSVIARPSGDQLRTYRVAIAATGEYTTFQGGTVAQALAAINTTLNRVNFIYIREVAIRMILVGNNTNIIWTNAATDPYSNGNPNAMIGQNQTIIDALIGSGNYDIGHVFGTNSGGLASLGVVCSAGSKARGVTGSGAPVGDAFDVDYVAHEMGHQFGANHTFNGNTGSCAGNRNANTAFEPGSGSTIMAYAGICNPQDLQPNSDAYFHTVSYDEIFAYSELGGGNGCAVITNPANTAPVPTIVTPTNLTIPRSTPFTITGSATDFHGDPITYCWEQYNLGSDGHPNAPVGDAPILRSFPPTSSGSRTFPKLSDLLNNTQTIGELLPSYTRTLIFNLTVRDNYSGGGGVDWAYSLNVNVDGTKGPFLVTSPNTALSWTTGTTQTVTWSVAGSDLAPVNCANVKISLSTDGGSTFPLVLLASTANDGSESIVVPNNLTNQARVKIEAVGNIFFDISNTNFSIVAPPPPPAPANLTATALNRSQIRLNWSDVSGETGYRIYRAVSGGFYAQITTVGADVTTFTDGGLTAGTLYYYYLQAYSASGNSPATPVVNATTASLSQYVMDGLSVSSCSGTFYDPGFTSDYGNNQSFTQTFSPATVGSKVRLNFSSFVTESGYDSLYVYNGPSTASPLIGAFTGTASPGIITATATNPTGQLTVRFKSDGSVVASGWVATLSCVVLPEYVMNGAPVSTCSGTFYDPGYTSDYGNNQSLTQTFSPATAGSKVRLNFSSFNTENTYDFLRIYDGPSTASPLMGAFTGTISPGIITATNPTGQLTVQFTSDGSVTASGWIATLSCVAPEYTMNGAPVSTCSGTFYDPGYTSDYGNNQSFTQTFSPGSTGSKVRLNFSSFNTENTYDFLRIYDGPSTASPLMGAFTGTISPGIITATNPTGQLTVQFTSDGSVVASGWVATLSCVVLPEYVMNGAPVSTCNGTFYDPGVTSDYSNNQSFTQTFSPATAGSKVRLNFSSFDTENAYDILRIYDGPSTASPLVGAFTGTTSPGVITATNPTGQLTVQFTSDGSVVASGWVADISCVVLPEYVMDGAPVSTCNGTLYDPGFTGDYGNNQSFTQTFSPATAGSKVRLNFSSFNTESGYDFLRIYDGPTTASPLIGTFTGTVSPGVVTATDSTGKLTVQFTSDGSVIAPGWVATLSCVSSSSTTAPSARQSVEPGLTLSLQAFPNPFSEKVTFDFTVEKTQPASLEIYDLKGVLVKKLFEGEAQAGQHYQVEWNAALLKSGLFIGRLTSGHQSATQKVILQR